MLAQQANASSTTAVVPTLVSFSGVLTGSNGKPLTGITGVTFSLYAEQNGGAPLWLETQNVQPDKNGNYSVMLGSTTSQGLPSSLFVSGQARWLEVQAQGQGPQPRVMLMSVPYALKAGDAQTIGGLPPSAFVLAAPPNGKSGSTTTGSTPQNPTPAGSSDVTTSGGTPGTIPFFNTATDIENSVITQTGTGSKAKVGINNSSPSTTLDIKGSSTVRGTLSLPATKTATATQGYDSQPIEQSASAYNSGSGTAVAQNFEWQAEPTGNDTPSPNGTLNLLFAQGSNKLAETGLNIASNGQITFAAGQSFPGAGTVTSVGSGLGLTGGPITNAGTLTIDTAVVPQLNAANNFTGNQTVNGNLSATGLVTGAGFQIGSNLFDYGNYSLQNAFTGFAGNTTATGIENTATGTQALSSLTLGGGNTANGVNALYSDMQGGENTAVGFEALYSNVIPNANTAVGAVALYSNTEGTYNTAIGLSALTTNTSGDNNTALGFQAGLAADNSNITGTNNTLLGSTAALGTGSLSNATAIGSRAEVAESNALVLGSIAGVNGSVSSVNVGIGTTAPAYTLDVHGTGNFTGLVNFASGQTFPGTVTGVTAGTGLSGGGSSGNVTLNNTGVLSVSAGTGISVTGSQNPSIGINTSVVPQLNVANTFTANQTVNGNLNLAGVVNASGGFATDNEMFDYGNLGLFNAFLGFAGNLTMTGGQNTASGAFALSGNSTGSNNTANGYYALVGNDWGSNNTASGYEAGLPNVYGNNDTFLGANSDPSTNWLDNATAVGANALVSESNALVLGSINGVNGATADTFVGIGTAAPITKLDIDANAKSALGPTLTLTNNGGSGQVSLDFNTYPPDPSGTYNPASRIWVADANNFSDNIYFQSNTGGEPNSGLQTNLAILSTGNVGIGTIAPDSLLTVNGSADKPGGGSWGTFSDRRLKDLDGSFSAGLSQIMKINPVKYRYKQDNGMGISDHGEHVGVVAQEIKEAIPEAVTRNSQGYLLVNNDPVIWAMLNAIKEQQKLIQNQQERIRAQQAKMKAQETRIDEQQAQIRSAVKLAQTQKAQVASQAAQIEAQQAASRLQQAQIAELMSQVKAIRASLQTNGGAGAEIRSVRAQVPLVQQ